MTAQVSSRKPQQLHTMSQNPTFRPNQSRILASLVTGVCLSSGLAFSQPITVPNFSFETPDAPLIYPYITFNLDSWQRPAQPGYFAAVEQNFGITWNNTTAIFFAPGVYGNMQGNQAAYLMSFPQVGLFQDNLTATFETGKSYSLTVGLFGKGFQGNMTEGSMLGISLFYLDGANQITIGAPTVVTYTAAEFATGGPLNLHDYQVSIPTVQFSDAWAGKNIGIRIDSIYGVGDGYWDVDNVRLVAVPEPSLTALVGVAAGLLFIRRKHD